MENYKLYFLLSVLHLKLKFLVFMRRKHHCNFLKRSNKKVERSSDWEKCHDVMVPIIFIQWQDDWHPGFCWPMNLSQVARLTNWITTQAAHILLKPQNSAAVLKSDIRTREDIQLIICVESDTHEHHFIFLVWIYFYAKRK